LTENDEVERIDFFGSLFSSVIVRSLEWGAI
jgi:hypothetical protein